MFTKLDYVYAVYKEKSFTKAAEKLFIAQPSLSAAIKNVEKEVGAPIFERSSAGLRLTEVGKEYIIAAEKMISVKEEFENKLNDIFGLETGHLTVGGTNYLSSYVLPKIINTFSCVFPKIEVELAEAKSLSLSEMLKREEIDIVIDSFDELLQEYQGYPLCKERILLCVPSDRAINKELKDYAIQAEDIFNDNLSLADIPPVSIEKFKAEDFVLLKNGNDMYNRAMRIFEKADMQPNVRFSVDQLNISYALAESGMGSCFVTDTLFRFGKFGNNTVLYNVKEAPTGRTLYVAHKKNKYCTKAMEQFIKIAKEITEARF